MKRVSTECHRHRAPLLLLLFSFLLLSACSSAPARRSEVDAGVDSLASAREQAFIRASFLAAGGDHPAAISGYRSLLSADRKNAALHFSMAKEFLALGELDSARAYGERAFALDTSNRYSTGLLADISHAMGDRKRAVELYGRLSEMDPVNTELLSWLAMEHLAAEEPEEALAVFRRVLRLDPGNETARSQVLLLEIRMQRYPEAIASLKEMIAGGAGDGRLRLTLGGIYLRTGDFADAAATFREALQAAPGFVPAWLALFEVSVRSVDMAAFRSDLTAFYDTVRPTVAKKLELTRFYLTESVSDTLYRVPARLMLDESCRRHPKHAEPLMLRGWVRLRDGDSPGAVQDFRAAVRLDRMNSDLRQSLVTALLASERFPEALISVRRALRDFPAERLRYRVLEGYVLYESGNPQGAARLLERALRSPEIEGERELHLRALSTLAFAYDTLGQSTKSIPVYERLLVLDPQDALVMNNLAYSLAERGTELEKARRLAEGAVSKEPLSGVFLDTLGWILYRQGAFDEALLRLRKAAELEPDEPEIFRHLSELYRAMGEGDEAAAMERRAAELELKRAGSGGAK
ncbi:tetratricopeptide repeat protein [Chlorobium sp. N1]|uniref:tetratricopeptide repeat protein n=1 Tax=Chlorobium sp. N1 TaxID=2491138 RepID=UPI00103B96C1|nr:tetratricopeptide repeat protein [Chlorobium sp. N1]TCD48746.1 tetratricopeptide repeat protein [Chlorobium sp. N1]